MCIRDSYHTIATIRDNENKEKNTNQVIELKNMELVKIEEEETIFKKLNKYYVCLLYTSTLEEACMVHGIDVEELLKELNK